MGVAKEAASSGVSVNMTSASEPVGRMRRSILALPAALALGKVGRAADATRLVYPRTETKTDRRDDYQVQLLELALARAGASYVLESHPLFMLQARSISELAQGRGLDTIWTMTSAEREAELLPVRVPIDRGLLGWRLLLVRRNDLARFANVRSLAQLRALRAGQGIDWPDTAILRSAGLQVDASVRYGDLFLKLAAGRIDFFPRSVVEVWGELDEHRGEGFSVEPHLVLRYPTAMYFFVNRKRPELAATIERGLLIAQRDGSFEALFEKHFGKDIQRAELARRERIELANPLLPAATPLADARLWYRP